MAASQDTDAELVLALETGDVGALRELHRRHAPWLRARLARRCSDRDIVDEAIQDAFVAVWQSAERFDPRGEVAAWIWTIAIRRRQRAAPASESVVAGVAAIRCRR